MANPRPNSARLLLAAAALWWLTLLQPIKPAAASKTRHFKWTVEYLLWAPDSVEVPTMGINGQYPGPTIRARAGDTLRVDLTNGLSTEGVVIHWHGIRQLGTPWADGTASISQCPIRPGESFTYRFKVDKAGTYFYHGHYGMQRSAGLYGSLIVDVAEGEDEPFRYDGEFNLLLSDWWHRTALELELDLSSKPFRWIGEPQSLLINGRGQYNCSLAPGIRVDNLSSTPMPLCELKGTEQCAPQILGVLPNKVYRLRLASVTSLASLNFAIQGHEMVVVEADGNYVDPFTVSDLDIYSGESYSVLLTTNQPPTANYWLSFGVRGRQPRTPPALTLLNYRPTRASKPPTGPPPTTPLWNNFTHSKAFSSRVHALSGMPGPPGQATRRVLLLNTQNKVNGFIRWAINNVSLGLPPTPYLGSIRFGVKGAFDAFAPPEGFPASYDIREPPANPNATVGSGVYFLGLNTTVDLVLQNANALAPNASEVHPWHLHGHNFWVLGYGQGKFEEADVSSLNRNNPPLKNTVVVFPYGWTALRFVADNPGVWAFHCHIEPHLHMGMGVVFAEGVDHIKSIPTNALACGLMQKVFMKRKYVP